MNPKLINTLAVINTGVKPIIVIKAPAAIGKTIVAMLPAPLIPR